MPRASGYLRVHADIDGRAAVARRDRDDRIVLGERLYRLQAPIGPVAYAPNEKPDRQRMLRFVARLSD